MSKDKAEALLKKAASLPPSQRSAAVMTMRSMDASNVESESDFWLDMANALERMNDHNPFAADARNVPEHVKAPVDAAVNRALQAADGVDLRIANELDKVYQAVAEQTEHVAKKAGDALSSNVIPLLLAAAVALYAFSRAKK